MFWDAPTNAIEIAFPLLLFTFSILELAYGATCMLHKSCHRPRHAVIFTDDVDSSLCHGVHHLAMIDLPKYRTGCTIKSFTATQAAPHSTESTHVPALCTVPRD